MSRSPKAAQLHDMTGCACLALRRAARAVTQMYDRALRSYRLRVTQLPILVAAARHRAVPLALLAEELGMDRTTLLRNVRPLARRGLVKIGTEAKSRRTVIRSTAAGRALVARVYPAWRKAQQELLRAAGPGWFTIVQTIHAAGRRA
jgi:DNA-binding MarR family transcriptional regulator